MAMAREGRRIGESPIVEEQIEVDYVRLTPSDQRSMEDHEMALSIFHKANQITLSEDRLSASSRKGYCMVRATRGVVDGTWYFEVELIHLGKTGHARLGWATQLAELQAPVGFDRNSYAYRDIEGISVHEGLRSPYGEPYFAGDTVGCCIKLPGGAHSTPDSQRIVMWKGRPYYMEKDSGTKSRLQGSEIVFFKNGVCQGTAFRDIYVGRYFPAASLYTLPDQPEPATVRFNFGPNFKHFPHDYFTTTMPQSLTDVKPRGVPYTDGISSDRMEDNQNVGQNDSAVATEGHNLMEVDHQDGQAQTGESGLEVTDRRTGGNHGGPELCNGSVEAEDKKKDIEAEDVEICNDDS